MKKPSTKIPYFRTDMKLVSKGRLARLSDNALRLFVTVMHHQTLSGRHDVVLLDSAVVYRSGLDAEKIPAAQVELVEAGLLRCILYSGSALYGPTTPVSA